MDVIRLVTVHPAIVHFTIGTLPVIVLAYAVARWRRSERWTFAGDVTLVITAALTLAVAASGLVAFLAISWPGGLGLWRWLHLGFGVASAVLLVGFSAWRLVRRRRERYSGGGTLAAAVAIALVIGWTGWIGGEVLVFRSGVAVRAAGDGALAPPAAGLDGEPGDLHEAMHQLRAHWAATQTTLAVMIVEEPTDERFDEIVEHTENMQRVARWLTDYDLHQGEGEPGGAVSAAATPALASLAHQGRPPEPHDHDHDHDQPHDHAAEDEAQEEAMSFARRLATMSAGFASRVDEAAERARARDLPGLAESAGEITRMCAGCHEQLRWGVDHEHHEH